MSNPPAIIARDAPGFVDCEPIIHPVDRIKNLVMKEFGVTYSDLDGWSRDARVVVPRHVAMSIARRLTTCSLKDISTRFGGRDHTTVVNAVKKLPMRMQCNPVLRERIEKIEAAFRRELAERAERKAVINTPILNAVEPTALELSACVFVAAMAEHVDAKRGVIARGGKRETQRDVARAVKECLDNCRGTRQQIDDDELEARR